MELFYAATTIDIGNGHTSSFWHAPWLDGLKPKDIAPKIFESSTRKNWSVFDAIHSGAWVNKIKLDAAFSIDHLSQFIDLWTHLSHVHLHEGVQDDIIWKFMNNGHYSAASAYQMQFLGLVYSPMYKMIWKAWAPPKTKNHAWLALQNKLWTTDRLQKRGWPNCGQCPLCKETMESTNHLFVHCRLTTRIWELLKEWLGIHGIQPRQWGHLSLKEWWSAMTVGASHFRKALGSLLLLTVWEIWNERNARIFNNKHSPTFVILDKIKCEARLWVIAGAKDLGRLMPGE
jgi:hypothetical protein